MLVSATRLSTRCEHGDVESVSYFANAPDIKFVMLDLEDRLTMDVF